MKTFLPQFVCMVLVLICLADAVRMGVAASSTPSGAATRPSLSVTPKRDAKEQYTIIDQRNIFLRNRSSRRGTNSESDATAAAVSPTSSAWVLTGIAIVGGDQIAFFEETPAGTTMQRRQGEMLGNTKLLAITDQGVLCQLEEKTFQLEVGSRLVGSGSVAIAVEPIAATPALPVNSAATTGSTTPSNSSSEAAILERLRARRNQEVSP